MDRAGSPSVEGGCGARPEAGGEGEAAASIARCVVSSVVISHLRHPLDWQALAAPLADSAGGTLGAGSTSLRIGREHRSQQRGEWR
jgi:hypothetical protein